MRKLSKLFTGAVTMAAAAALVAGTVTTASAAPNDPPTGVVPKISDIVTVGSNTTEFLWDQLSTNYNKTHSGTKLYSYDAVPPGSTSSAPTTIKQIKKGCAPITRPNGSTAGWKALNVAQKIGSNYCIDFSRSSSFRATTGGAPNTLTYVVLARDAITWATRDTKGGTDAPASLTLAQLQGIFTCKTTNWKSVGGKNGKISVYLPQAGSGTLSTWETFMGINPDKVPSCISQKPEENEGTYSGFNSPNSVFIYSIGAYVAQKFHKNSFGANLTGFLGINKIDGVSPLTSAKVPTINPGFPSGFFRGLYDVVRGTDKISQANLVGILGPSGYACKNPAVIGDYGFLPASNCGALNVKAA